MNPVVPLATAGENDPGLPRPSRRAAPLATAGVNDPLPMASPPRASIDVRAMDEAHARFSAMRGTIRPAVIFVPRPCRFYTDLLIDQTVWGQDPWGQRLDNGQRKERFTFLDGFVTTTSESRRPSPHYWAVLRQPDWREIITNLSHGSENYYKGRFRSSCLACFLVWSPKFFLRFVFAVWLDWAQNLFECNCRHCRKRARTYNYSA